MSGQGPSPTSGQESDKDQLRPPSRSGDRSDEEDYGRQSFESSRYTSGVASTVGTDAEEDNSDADSEPRSHHSHNHRQHHHQQHKAFESALKEKTRHLLGLVKMDGILTGSPGRRNHNSNNSDNNNIGRRVSNRKRGESTSTARRERRKEEQDRNEYESRRASMSSFASTNIGTEYTTEPDIGRLSNSSYRSIRNPTASSQDDHLGIPSKTDRSVTSHSSASPPSYAGDWTKPPFTRRLSGMKRTSSSKSVYRELEEGDDLDNDLDIDRREGVYDSSKKQRVPSWVRVFFTLISLSRKCKLIVTMKSVIECCGKRTLPPIHLLSRSVKTMTLRLTMNGHYQESPPHFLILVGISGYQWDVHLPRNLLCWYPPQQGLGRNWNML